MDAKAGNYLGNRSLPNPDAAGFIENCLDTGVEHATMGRKKALDLTFPLFLKP